MHKKHAILWFLMSILAGCTELQPEREADPAESEALPEQVEQEQEQVEQELEQDQAAQEGALATLEQELRGETVCLGGCNAAQCQKVREAISWLMGRVTQASYLDCLRDSHMTDSDWAMAEEIFDLSNTALPVQVDCKEDSTNSCGGSTSWAGCAGAIGEGDPERLSLSYDFLAAASVESIGSTILHEIMHNHSFWHPHYVGFSVPDAVAGCVNGYRPQGLARSGLSDWAATAHAGGAGSSEGTLFCSQGELMVGVRGATNPALVRYAPVCATQAVNGLGPARDAGGELNAPAGSVQFRDVCPAGQAVYGMRGDAGDSVGRVSLLCAPLAYFSGGATGAATTPRRGQATGTTFERLCPSRKAAMGIRHAQGNRLDLLQLVCDEAQFGQRRVGITGGAGLGPVGGQGGMRFERHCDGNGVMTGLFGQRNGNQQLRNIGSYCNPMTGRELATAAYRTEIAGGRQLGDSSFRYPCPTGQVMVGVRGRESIVVNSAAPLCISYASWLGSGNPVLAAGADLGSAGNLYERRCARGQVASGFWGRQGDLVDQLQLLCIQPEGGASLTRSQARGGNGGSPFVSRCSGGGPLTGLESYRNNQRLTGLGGQCGPVRGDSVIHRDGPALMLQGATSTFRNLDPCPVGHVLIGLRGRSGQYVEAAGGICAPLASWRNGQNNGTVFLTQRGSASAGNAFDLRCPAGQAVMGFEGLSGGLVDNIRLLCGRLDLLPGDSIAEQLTGVGDFDIFRVAVPQGAADLRFSLDGPAGADFELAARRTTSPDFSPDLSATGPAADETVEYAGAVEQDLYFVKVWSSFGSGNYALTVTAD